MLIWNKTNKAHDIRIKGKYAHSMKDTDFSSAIGTPGQKETAISAGINTKFSAAAYGFKTALHIESEKPLRYALWCGPQGYELPEEWWSEEEKVVEEKNL